MEMCVLKSRLALVAFVFVGMTSFCRLAYADGCDNLPSNTKWTNGIADIKRYTEAEKYDKSLEVARKLYKICDRSPVLNYYIGLSLQGNGEDVKATQYLQRASELTKEVSVSVETTRLIYYARYESEYPERTEKAVNARSEEIHELQDENKRLRALINSAQIEQAEYKSVDQAIKAPEKIRYAQMMWVGISTGILGVALTTVGSTLFATVDNYKMDHGKPHIAPAYISGWTLFGVGLGLTISGAVTAGIAGYRYTHIDDYVDLTVSVAPNNVSLSLVF